MTFDNHDANARRKQLEHLHAKSKLELSSTKSRDLRYAIIDSIDTGAGRGCVISDLKDQFSINDIEDELDLMLDKGLLHDRGAYYTVNWDKNKDIVND